MFIHAAQFILSIFAMSFSLAMHVVDANPVNMTKSHACKLELGLILDASSSVKRKNYDKVKQFIMQMVDDFDISKEGSHFGIIHYSDMAYLDFSFNDEQYHNKEALKKKIKSIIYSYGGTRTDKALRLASKKFFCKSCCRPNGKKVLLVITDGISNPGSESLELATKEMKEKNVDILSLGVGYYISKSELHTIASFPKKEHVFLMNTFDDLKSHISEIEASACGEALHGI